MCTAAAFQNKHFFFGRNLDLDYSYEEQVTVTPRNFPFVFRNTKKIESHYAMIGMAYITEDYPLYYEATNEAGLSMAGLNFPGNAVYRSCKSGISDECDNIATFEFIPWILSQCGTLAAVRNKLSRLNLTDTVFNENLPPAQLHWMISGREGSLVVEAVADGLKIYENPIGILTNNPPFPYHMANLSNYMNLSAAPAQNRFSDKLELHAYSRGMGAVGLPGDLSSASRFVKAAFTKLNSCCGASEEESVSQFFHILRSVEQQQGCVRIGEDKYEITIYSSCCNADKGIYYYTTYNNSMITAVDMHREDLDGDRLIAYPMIQKQQVYLMNGAAKGCCLH